MDAVGVISVDGPGVWVAGVVNQGGEWSREDLL
jgi:hypothetical protein